MLSLSSLEGCVESSSLEACVESSVMGCVVETKVVCVVCVDASHQVWF